MAFRLEGSNKNEIKEAPPQQNNTEKLSEPKESPENYEDCALKSKESLQNEVNEKQNEELEENFDDCKAKLEDIEEKHPEITEEDDDDFSDCGNEVDSGYVVEVTYIHNGEVSEEEADQEIRKAYNECSDPEDMAQLKENINENENITVVSAEVVERPDPSQQVEEIEKEELKQEYDDVKQEFEEAKERLDEQNNSSEISEEPVCTENEDTEKSSINSINNETEDVDEVNIESNDTETPQGEKVSEIDESLDKTSENNEDVTDAKAEDISEDDKSSVAESKDLVEEQKAEVQNEDTEPVFETEEKSFVKNTEKDSEIQLTKDDIDELTEADTDKVQVDNIDKEDITKAVEEKIESESSGADTEVSVSEEQQEQFESTIESELLDKSEGGKIEVGELNNVIADQAQEEISKSEELNNEISDEIKDSTSEIVDDSLENDKNLSNEDLQDAVESDVIENVENNQENNEENNVSVDEDRINTIIEERSDEVKDTIEEKQEDVVDQEVIEETPEKLEAEVESINAEIEQASLFERIDSALTKDELSSSEINELQDETNAELFEKREQRVQIESELTEKFDEVLSKDRGSVEYKQALKEYNDLKDQKASLDEQVSQLEEQKDILSKKSLELRDAQLEKGEIAISASDETLEKAKTLQESFDKNYYGVNRNTDSLDALQKQNDTVISELVAEKESIKLAMEAKMDEIADYVYSNNMGRYETSIDPYYQQLTKEYLSMQAVLTQVEYSAVKLDANNLAISDVTGKEYLSRLEAKPVSKIDAINEGADIPGETNYFVDETKATEVLTKFKADEWEKLNLNEKKSAIAALADYNAEILGVEDKPRIVYYYDEKPGEFGGFSDKLNTIFINEYNIDNAAEAADTIAHEYRHKYQHLRAERLENERDLEFKQGFDNYIRAEDDYAEYENQFVEREARSYAEIFKNKIESLSNVEEKTESPKLNSIDDPASFTELNPEKGAVFDFVSKNELPDDFDAKEIVLDKEGLNVRELNELRNMVAPHYKNGVEIAENVKDFNGYKEHHDFETGHIEKVREKALEAAAALESHFSLNNYDGLFSSKIDRRTIEVMSLYHDTGMDGNIKAADYETEKEAYTSNEEYRKKYIAKEVSKKQDNALKTGKLFDRAAEEEKANKKFENQGFEEQFRPNHSLESAIHALRDRDSIIKLGVNPDEIALACLVHSKSNSGVRNIASENDWLTAIGRLQNRVNEFNASHPDEQIHFDSSFLLNNDGSFNQDKLAEMRSEAIVLRIGDANGHDTNSRTSQNGKAIEFSLEKKVVSEEVPGDLEGKIRNGDYKPYFLEVQAAFVKIDGKEQDNISDPAGIVRMYAVGEGNFKSLSCEVDDNGSIKQNFVLCDGNAFPLSTQKCIEERLGEYQTAEPLKYVAVIKLDSNCSKEAFASYNAFARRVKKQYRIRMEVIK